jgi:hypothetical protein
MPFKKGEYNPTTAYYQAKKPQKIPTEPGKSVQYPPPFKQWLVCRAEKEGIRAAFRSAGVPHSNYYPWKQQMNQSEEDMEEGLYIKNFFYFLQKI